MSAVKMRRTVCLECIAVCGVMQLLMTYLIVHVFMSPTSEVVHSDSRLLLSLADPPTGPKLDSAESSMEVVENLSMSVASDRGLLDKWRRHKTNLFVATGSDWKQLSDSRQVNKFYNPIFEMLNDLLRSKSCQMIYNCLTHYFN